MILTAQNLSCRRGGRLIFSDVSFRLRCGDALVITGDNGAGKSSLMAVLAGLLSPASGEVRLEGDQGMELAHAICLMGHRDGLKPSLTVGENLDYARRLLGPGARSIDEALVIVGLAHAVEMPVEHLSAGQRRRVSLARLLSCSRPIWLMDEPAGALDQRSLRTLTDVMEGHLGNGGMIIAATHQSLGLSRFTPLHLTAPATALTDDCYWEDDDVDDDRLMGASTSSGL